MIARLEFPYDDIQLHVTSKVERDKRLTAVSKEEETVAFLEEMEPGFVFVDVGANTGAYSLIAGSRGVKTFAFEPHPATFRRLVENIELNELQNRVTPLSRLLSSKTGVIGFTPSSEEPGSASHTIDVTGDGQQAWALDYLVDVGTLPFPRYMKVDTDGHELAVLGGAKNCLSQIEAVQVEIDDTLHVTHEIIELLALHGLREAKWTRHGNTAISNVLFRRLDVP